MTNSKVATPEPPLPVPSGAQFNVSLSSPFQLLVSRPADGCISSDSLPSAIINYSGWFVCFQGERVRLTTIIHRKKKKKRKEKTACDYHLSPQASPQDENRDFFEIGSLKKTWMHSSRKAARWA